MKIEKNIPVPAVGAPVVRQSKYPFPFMEVGDSLLGKGKEGNKLRSAAAGYAERHGIKFATRTVAADKSVRVWRVA